MRDYLLVQFDRDGFSFLARPLTFLEDGWEKGPIELLSPEQVRKNRIWVEDWNGDLILINEESLE